MGVNASINVSEDVSVNVISPQDVSSFLHKWISPAKL